MSPPTTATAIGWRNSTSAPRPTATGAMPAPMATVVIRIGRARLWAASSSASVRVMPPLMASSAYSTSRIEFFAAMPISIRMPIREEIEKVLPMISRPTNAPPMASGSAAMMVIGWVKLLNSSASTAYIRIRPVMKAPAKPTTISTRNSASPVMPCVTPAGRFLTEGRRLTAIVASPLVMPFSSAVIVATRDRSSRFSCEGPAP